MDRIVAELERWGAKDINANSIRVYFRVEGVDCSISFIKYEWSVKICTIGPELRLRDEDDAVALARILARGGAE